MNIFVLDEKPKTAAIYHCDAHVNKMIVESAQMLSTAHRVLDGREERRPSKSGKRMVQYWVHPTHEDVLYKAVHMKHPCTLWTMESLANYQWHYRLFNYLTLEYRWRYKKSNHKSFELLGGILLNPPSNIPDVGLTPFRLAMGSNPECMNPDNPVESYRRFYETKQERFNMRWTNRDVPSWFNQKLQEVSA